MGAAASGLWLQTVPPELEKRTFSLVSGTGDGCVVGGSRFASAAEPAQQVCAGRVIQVVTIEADLVNDVERGRWIVDLGNSDTAVERHHRRGCDRHQLVVERENLSPVGRRGSRSIAV